jgi:hypothetical protein
LANDFPRFQNPGFLKKIAPSNLIYIENLKNCQKKLGIDGVTKFFIAVTKKNSTIVGDYSGFTS